MKEILPNQPNTHEPVTEAPTHANGKVALTVIERNFSMRHFAIMHEIKNEFAEGRRTHTRELERISGHIAISGQYCPRPETHQGSSSFSTDSCRLSSWPAWTGNDIT